MSFRLEPKSVTLNDLERRKGFYFALFHRVNATYITCSLYRQRSHMTLCVILLQGSDIFKNYLFTVNSDTSIS